MPRSPSSSQDRSAVPAPQPATGHPPFWLWGVALALCVGGVLVVFGYGARVYQAEEAIPALGAVPAFTLQERSGVTVTQTDLLGKVWIANFIFTRCTTECPLMSSQMARLQEAFQAEPDVRLVSITVDPQYDTSEILTRYAQSFAAHPQRWLFLTGDKTAIYRLAREGFHLGVIDPQEPERSSARPLRRQFATRMLQAVAPAPAFAHHGAHTEKPAAQAITHSGRFVLVDRQGQIRQYYDSTDMEALRHLQRAVRRVLQES